MHLLGLELEERPLFLVESLPKGFRVQRLEIGQSWKRNWKSLKSFETFCLCVCPKWGRIPEHQTLTAGKTKRVATIRWETQSEQRPNDYVQTTETSVAWWYVILISNANCSNLRTCRFFFDCGCFHFHLGLSPSKQQNCKRLRCRWIEQESVCFNAIVVVLFCFKYACVLARLPLTNPTCYFAMNRFALVLLFAHSSELFTEDVCNHCARLWGSLVKRDLVMCENVIYLLK